MLGNFTQAPLFYFKQLLQNFSTPKVGVTALLFCSFNPKSSVNEIGSWCPAKNIESHIPTDFFQAYLGLNLSPNEDEQPDVIIERLKELLSDDNSHFLNRFVTN